MVSSTGCPHTILNREDLASIMPARRNRPLFLVDIAVPRDINADVQELANVYLYNVDHMEAIVRENVCLREKELVRCRAIIAERAAALMARFTPAPTKFSRGPLNLNQIGCCAGQSPAKANPNEKACAQNQPTSTVNPLKTEDFDGSAFRAFAAEPSFRWKAQHRLDARLGTCPFPFATHSLGKRKRPA